MTRLQNQNDNRDVSRSYTEEIHQKPVGEKSSAIPVRKIRKIVAVIKGCLRDEKTV
jgi:hypothetical protein